MSDSAMFSLAIAGESCRRKTPEREPIDIIQPRPPAITKPLTNDIASSNR